MPIGQAASGTARGYPHAVTFDGVASGTAVGTVASPGGGYASGTADVDRTVLLAFLGGGSEATDGGLIRHCSARVTINGDDVPSLVDTVTVDEALDDPVKMAEFSIADPLVASGVYGSYSDGDLDCTVDLLAGPPGNVQTWRAFTGLTEASPNQGAYRPRASFRAIGVASRWATVDGCVRKGAFSGFTRGQLLEVLCESAGITIANAGVALLGAIVQRPVEFIGNAVDFVKRVGEVEGWHLAPNDAGELELVFEANLLAGPITWAFDHSNTFGVDQVPPSQPVTKWTLSCSVLTPETLSPPGQVTTITQDGGFTPAGDPWTTITELLTDQGVEIFRRVTEYQTIGTPGTTTGPPTLQPVSKTEVQTDWVQAIIDPTTSLPRFTTKLEQRVTKTYQLTGIPCGITAGGSLWHDASAAEIGYYTTAQASLILVSETRERFSWSSLLAGYASDCSLLSEERTTQAWYSPLADPATGYEYSDGSFRLHNSYQYGNREQEIVTWSDYRYPALVGTIAAQPRVVATSRRLRYVKVGLSVPEGTDIESTTIRDAEVQIREWLGNNDNSHYVYTSRLVLPNPAITQGPLAGGGTQLAFVREENDGQVPGPSFGSSETPQIKQQVIVATFDMTSAVPYKPSYSNEVFEIAESVDELQAVAMRRFRRALSTVLHVRHRDLPALKVGQRVSVTNTPRALEAVEGYVSAIQRTRVLATGEGRQITTVVVPPGF